MQSDPNRTPNKESGHHIPGLARNCTPRSNTMRSDRSTAGVNDQHQTLTDSAAVTPSRLSRCFPYPVNSPDEWQMASQSTPLRSLQRTPSSSTTITTTNNTTYHTALHDPIERSFQTPLRTTATAHRPPLPNHIIAQQTATTRPDSIMSASVAASKAPPPSPILPRSRNRSFQRTNDQRTMPPPSSTIQSSVGGSTANDRFDSTPFSISHSGLRRSHLPISVNRSSSMCATNRFPTIQQHNSQLPHHFVEPNPSTIAQHHQSRLVVDVPSTTSLVQIPSSKDGDSFHSQSQPSSILPQINPLLLRPPPSGCNDTPASILQRRYNPCQMSSTPTRAPHTTPVEPTPRSQNRLEALVKTHSEDQRLAISKAASMCTSELEKWVLSTPAGQLRVLDELNGSFYRNDRMPADYDNNVGDSVQNFDDTSLMLSTSMDALNNEESILNSSLFQPSGARVPAPVKSSVASTSEVLANSSKLAVPNNTVEDNMHIEANPSIDEAQQLDFKIDEISLCKRNALDASAIDSNADNEKSEAVSMEKTNSEDYRVGLERSSPNDSCMLLIDTIESDRYDEHVKPDSNDRVNPLGLPDVAQLAKSLNEQKSDVNACDEPSASSSSSSADLSNCDGSAESGECFQSDQSLASGESDDKTASGHISQLSSSSIEEKNDIVCANVSQHNLVNRSTLQQDGPRTMSSATEHENRSPLTKDTELLTPVLLKQFECNEHSIAATGQDGGLNAPSDDEKTSTDQTQAELLLDRTGKTLLDNPTPDHSIVGDLGSTAAPRGDLNDSKENLHESGIFADDEKEKSTAFDGSCKVVVVKESDAEEAIHVINSDDTASEFNQFIECNQDCSMKAIEESQEKAQYVSLDESFVEKDRKKCSGSTIGELSLATDTTANLTKESTDYLMSSSNEKTIGISILEETGPQIILDIFNEPSELCSTSPTAIESPPGDDAGASEQVDAGISSIKNAESSCVVLPPIDNEVADDCKPFVAASVDATKPPMRKRKLATSEACNHSSNPSKQSKINKDSSPSQASSQTSPPATRLRQSSRLAQAIKPGKMSLKSTAKATSPKAIVKGKRKAPAKRNPAGKANAAKIKQSVKTKTKPPVKNSQTTAKSKKPPARRVTKNTKTADVSEKLAKPAMTSSGSVSSSKPPPNPHSTRNGSKKAVVQFSPVGIVTRRMSKQIEKTKNIQKENDEFSTATITNTRVLRPRR